MTRSPNKYLIVVARYHGRKQFLFEKYISPKNQNYCKNHGIQYIEINNSYNLPDFPRHSSWLKFYVDRWLLQSGQIKDGDTIIHWDADMVIVKPEYEYTTNKSFSYAIDNFNAHSTGNYCLKINDWSKSLINLLLDENLNNKYKNTRRWKFWREQAAWYHLAGIQHNHDISSFDIKDCGFHSLENHQSLFSIDELRDHVEIKSPSWNCTVIPSEIDNPAVKRLVKNHFILPTLKSEMIIRHFAGQQPWRLEYLIK